MRRLVYVVMDGVGVGALPDAAEYGDEGSDTLGNTARAVGLRLPFLRDLGLGNITPLAGVSPVKAPSSFLGRLAPRSLGKDSTVGHWEQMGLVTSEPFPTYPEGFPKEVMDEFSSMIGRAALGNRSASGTEIIAELGDQHIATGRPIVYTSADSVFQVAAHVSIVPLDTLYAWCDIARHILSGSHGVARVIARPFAGSTGSYYRTTDRRDLSLPPHGPTYLDRLQSETVEVVGIGKIAEIFAGRGVDRSFKVGSNDENLALLEELVAGGSMRNRESGQLIITNLVDFDTTWGHRNDVDGFAEGLQVADAGLSRIAGLLRAEDRLVVTADHGVDPSTPSTDHSREYVPLLIYPGLPKAPRAVYEGEFSDAGAFAFEYLAEQPADLEGRSVAALKPSRGWRSYTPSVRDPAGSSGDMPVRLGRDDSQEAGEWLGGVLGPPPDMAIILGSGLSLTGVADAEESVPYSSVPHWPEAEVLGHPSILAICRLEGRVCVLLQGRVHEYEGFDVSEIQVGIKSLRAWGVPKVLLTSAAGGVAAELRPGTVLAVEEVLDFHYPAPAGWHCRLDATDKPALAALRSESPGNGGLTPVGTHASVPGPQYETPAELAHLARLGASTVSMGPAAELRAAKEEGMGAAVLSVVTNVGMTTHNEVLRAGAAASQGLTSAVRRLCRHWA